MNLVASITSSYRFHLVKGLAFCFVLLLIYYLNIDLRHRKVHENITIFLFHLLEPWTWVQYHLYFFFFFCFV